MTNPDFNSGAVNAGECVSNAWEMLKGKYGMYLGISLLTMVLTGCIPCINIFIAGPVMAGVFLVALRDMRGEPVEFGMMFKGFEKFVPLMVIGLIQAIPGIIGQVAQYALRIAQFSLQGPPRERSTSFFQSSGDFALSGGILVLIIVFSLAFIVFAFFWWVVFFCAVPLAMEYDLGAIDAIKLSARAGMANIGGLLVLMIFEILVGFLGTLLLCVGILLISVPVTLLANAFAYRQIFPWVERQMNMAPPDPGQYGFGGGVPPQQWS